MKHVMDPKLIRRQLYNRNKFDIAIVSRLRDGRWLLAYVRSQLATDGKVHSGYRSANYEDEWLTKTIEIVNRKFPEFTPTQAQRLAIAQYALGSSDD